MYFEITTTGRIVTDRDIKLAYEICTGHTFNFEHDDANYRRWANLCHIRRIPDSKITVEKQKIAESAMRRIGYYISSNSNYLNIPENDRYSFDSFCFMSSFSIIPSTFSF